MTCPEFYGKYVRKTVILIPNESSNIAFYSRPSPPSVCKYITHAACLNVGFGSSGLGKGLRVCISVGLPGDAEAAGPLAMSWGAELCLLLCWRPESSH